jgi:hypothetical protein
MDTDDGIRWRGRLTACVQCGRVLEGDRLLFCTDPCRKEWLRARGLMLTKDDQQKQSGRARRGLELHERLYRKESNEYIQRLAAS